MPGDLEALMVLRVQGISSLERAACALATDTDRAEERMRALVDQELATERTGRVAGFTLTPLGIEALDKLLADEGSRTDDTVSECYERFMKVNQRIIKVSTDWQVRRERGAEVPNDHSDPAYDFSVIERLIDLHDRARECLQDLAKHRPRFAPYVDRLESCVKRLETGDRTAFTAPLAESYHTVWFELHQDLLLTLGLTREE